MNDQNVKQEYEADSFLPQLAKLGDAERISRPTLTYFQDAFMRFGRNKTGMFCLIILALILSVGVIGPWFFPKVPSGQYVNFQNLDAISQPPNLGKKVMVVDDGFSVPEPVIDASYPTDVPLSLAENLSPPRDLSQEGIATATAVTLKWRAVPGVSGYKIYRSSIDENDVVTVKEAQNDAAQRGVEVANIDNPAQITGSDSSGLNPVEAYVYSVVSYVINSESQELVESTLASTIKLSLIATIPLTNAPKNSKIGDFVTSRPSLFGSDYLGRDLFARMVEGTRTDFFLALLIPTLALLIGLFYGATAGLAGGKVDMIMMRVIDVLDPLPFLLVSILIQVHLGKGLFSLIVALSILGWTSFARVIRGEVLRLREIEFVHASRLLGASTFRIILRHISPNLIGVLLVMWSARIPGVIATEASLSVLGLGLEPPNPSWGMCLSDAAQTFQNYPAQFFLSSAVLATALLAFYMLGDALTEAFDPKLRGRD